MRFDRPVFIIFALLLTVAAGACGGSATKRDARRLENKCGVASGAAVTEDQARCIAEIYGVQHKKKCPMEVDRPDGFGGPVYRVRESCNGLGVVLLEANGRVVALVSGDEVLHE